MNSELTPREIVKGAAYVLAEELLARKGFKLSRSNSLNAISLACGFKEWNVLSALCYRGIEMDAVLVAERHADQLAHYLVERHWIDVTVLECAEIIRTIAREVEGVLADSSPK